MKKILCYIAIVILICIIALPPFLRRFYTGQKKEPLIIDKYELLTCKKDNFLIASSYKNQEILNIRFSYYEEELDLEDLDEEKELEILLIRTLSNDRKTIIESKIDNENNQVLYTLKINDANSNTLDNLSNYRFKINEQKDYYTIKGYNCNIIEG